MALIKIILTILACTVLAQLIICIVFGFATKKSSYWEGFMDGLSWLSFDEDDTYDDEI